MEKDTKMNELVRWEKKQNKRLQRYVPIASALLGANPLRYIGYRLRYFIIITIVGLASHVIEFSVLFDHLAIKNFITLIYFKAILMLITGTWWACLEILREKVRDFYKGNHKLKISAEITAWLTLTALICLVIILSSSTIIQKPWKDITQGKLPLFDLYFFTLLIQFGCQLFSKTLHAGCYAIKRIYRPIGNILIFEVVGLGLLALLYPFFHAYSLPLAFFIASLLNVCASIYYSINMYKFLNIKAFHYRSILKNYKERLIRIFNIRLLLACFSGLLMQIESVLLVMLLYHTVHDHDNTHATVVIYFISPLIRASFNWVKLFYYDLRRYSHRRYQLMIKNLNKAITQAAFIIAIAFWLLSFFISIFFNLKDAYLLLMLLPFYLVRSIVAHKQIDAFCQDRYFDIILSGLIITAALLFCLLANLPIDPLLTTVTIAMAASCFYLYIIATKPIPYNPSGSHTFPLYTWIHRLRREKRGIRIYSLSFSKKKSGQHIKALLNKMKDDKRCHFSSTRPGEDHLFCYERNRYFQYRHSVIQLASGTIRDFNILNNTTGEKSYRQLIATSIIGKPQNFSQQPQEVFLQRFSDGIIIDLTKKKHDVISHFPPEQVSDIFYQVEHFAKYPLKKITQRSYYATAYFIDDIIQMIFIINRQTHDKKAINRWQDAIHSFNIQ